MREIVVDTETTGLDPRSGHRLVEVACIELVNHVPTGNHFWKYVNPDRDMPAEAFAVHGLSEAFLADHPLFAEIAAELLAFIREDTLVIHNAAFDIGFLNAELERIDGPAIPLTRAVDTVQLARSKYPGAQASLDALCRRFEIDNSARTKHGALLDAELLAEVYLELIGGRQPEMALAGREDGDAAARTAERPVRPPRPHAASETERAAHAAFLERIKEPVWRR